MHEMSLCEGVIRVIEEQAVVHNYTSVKSVTLEVGCLSCVLPESMQMCFEAISRGSRADGAELKIEVVPGVAKCRECGATVEVEDRISPCPECGQFGLRIKAGDTLRIKEMEVD